MWIALPKPPVAEKSGCLGFHSSARGTEPCVIIEIVVFVVVTMTTTAGQYGRSKLLLYGLLLIISSSTLHAFIAPQPQLPTNPAASFFWTAQKRSTLPRAGTVVENDEWTSTTTGTTTPEGATTTSGRRTTAPNPVIGKMEWNGYGGEQIRYSTMLHEPGFHRLLTRGGGSRGRRADQDDDEDEDGWKDMRKRPWSWTKRIATFVSNSRTVVDRQEPGTLILIRHGESTWNANKTFTGWSDYADLSERGCREVEHAARLLLEGGYDIDVVFTSRLQRAIRSVWIILQELNQVYLPVFKSWRLNERMYGALTGLSKIDTAEQLGHDIVQSWRNSLHAYVLLVVLVSKQRYDPNIKCDLFIFGVGNSHLLFSLFGSLSHTYTISVNHHATNTTPNRRPPSTTQQHEHWPGRERKYADLRPDQIPMTESLLDCMRRTIPIWNNRILYELRNGRNVMVVAHAHTLRGLVKAIDNISDEDIKQVAIPTGIPIIYKFDHKLESLPPPGDLQTASQVHMNGLFLEEPGLLKQALAREEGTLVIPACWLSDIDSHE